MNDPVTSTPEAQPSANAQPSIDWNALDQRAVLYSKQAERQASDRSYQAQRNSATWGTSLTNIPLGIGQGVANLGKSTVRLADDAVELFGGDLADDEDLKPFRWTTTNTGDVVSGITEFATAMAAPEAAIGDAAEAYQLGKTATTFAKVLGGGAAADFITDAHEERLSNGLQKLATSWNMPLLSEAAGLLAQKDGEGKFESRLKRAAEGVPMGLFGELTLKAVGKFGRAIFKSKAGEKEAAAELWQQGYKAFGEHATAQKVINDVADRFPRISSQEAHDSLFIAHQMEKAVNPSATIDDTLNSISIESGVQLDAEDALAQKVIQRAKKGPYATGPIQSFDNPTTINDSGIPLAEPASPSYSGMTAYEKKNAQGVVRERSNSVEPSVRGGDYLNGLQRTATDHPYGAAVQVKDSGFYSDPTTKLYLSEDKLAGAAVTADGDLVSVFKHPSSKTDINPILSEAAKNSKTLDGFDINGKLPELYGQHGFRPVARIPFNEEYAPKGWNYEKAGKPDVVLMVRDLDGRSGLPEVGKGDWVKIKDSVPVYNNYDEAVAAQQSAVAKAAGVPADGLPLVNPADPLDITANARPVAQVTQEAPLTDTIRNLEQTDAEAKLAARDASVEGGRSNTDLSSVGNDLPEAAQFRQAQATKEDSIILGLAKLVENNRVSIWMHQNASVLTLNEELVHSFMLRNFSQIPDELRNSVLSALKLPATTDMRVLSQAVRDGHEELAQQFLRWSYEGKQPNSILNPFFEKFRSFFRAAYEAYDKPQIAADMKPEIRKMYEILTGTRTLDVPNVVTSPTGVAHGPGFEAALAQRIVPVPDDVKKQIESSLMDAIQNDKLTYAQAVSRATGEINVRRLGIDGDVQAAVQEVEKKLVGLHDQIAGGVRSNEDVLERAKAIAEIIGDSSERGIAYAAKLSKEVQGLDSKSVAVRMNVAAFANDMMDSARVAVTDPTKRELVAQAVERYAELSKYQGAAQTEIARGLHAYNIVADPVEKIFNGKEIVNAIRNGQNTTATSQLINSIAAAADDTSLTSILRGWEDRLSKSKFSWWEVHNAVWISNLLTGVKTHVANIAGQAFMSLYQPASRIAGGEVSSGFRLYSNLLSGFQDMFTISEAGLRVNPDGALSKAMKAFVTEHPILDNITKEGVQPRVKTLSAEYFGMQPGTIQANAMNWLGNTVTLGSRFLTSVDEMFKQVNYRAALREEAYSAAERSGLQAGSDTFGSFVEKYIAEGFNEHGNGMNPVALRYAKRSTFTSDLVEGSLLKGYEELAAAHPSLKALTPFIRVPINILKEVRDMTPGLNLLFSDFRKQLLSPDEFVRSEARGRMAIGAGFWSLALGAAYSGRITGNGPKDPEQRAALMATGWRPLSIRNAAGDYISYGRFEPIAMLAGMAADMTDVLTNAKEGESMNAVYGIMTATIKNLSSKTYLTSLHDVLDAINDPDSKLTAWARNRLGSYVPADVSQFNQDPYMRDARGLLDAVRSKLPGFSENLPAKRDLFGDKVATTPGYVPFGADTALANVASPARFSKLVGDPVKDELAKLQYGFSQPPSNYRGVSLKDIRTGGPNSMTAYERWQELHGQVKIAGKTLPEAMTELMKSPYYKKLPDPDGPNDQFSEKVKAVRSVLGAYRELAAQKMLGEYPQVNQMRQLLENKIRSNQPSTRDNLLQRIAG